MGVAVVEVGNVRMRVDHFGMVVLVGVPAGEPIGMLMIMVAVVVGVFVFVHEVGVVVFVLVARTQRDRNTHGGYGRCDHLQRGDGCGEPDPCNSSTDERGSREDHLASCSAELAGTFDPLGDRDAISPSANGERSNNFGRCRAVAPTDNGETDGQVGGTCDETFERDDVFRGKVLDTCGDAVVKTPADTCGDHEQCTECEAGTWLPDEQRTRSGDEHDAGQYAGTEVLMEERSGKYGGGGEFGVEKDRRSGGVDAGKACHEQNWCDRAADDDGDKRGAPLATDRITVWWSSDRGGCDGKGGAQVEQPGKRERRDRSGELRSGRGGRAKQDGSDQAPQYPDTVHTPSVPGHRQVRTGSRLNPDLAIFGMPGISLRHRRHGLGRPTAESTATR